MLNLPDDLRITTASVGNLTINVPLDFHRSPIEIFLDGIEVSATLQSPPEIESGKTKKRKGRRKHSGEERGVMTTSILPSPEEVARDFVQRQPRKVKRKLEQSIIAAYGEGSNMHSDFGYASDNLEDSLSLYGEHYHQTSPDPYSPQQHSRRTSGSSIHSGRPTLTPTFKEVEEDKRAVEEQVQEDYDDSSDEDVELGRGTALDVPEFVASFIKGIGDRLQLHVGEVSASIQIPRSQTLPQFSGPKEASSMEDQVVTLELQIGGIAIDGVTIATAEVDISAFAPSGSGQIKAGKKKIRLNRLNAFLIGEEGWFCEEEPSMIGQEVQALPSDCDETSSPYTHMQESICTVKDIGTSVATLKGGEITPRISSTEAVESQPLLQQPLLSSTHALSSMSDDDDDVFESPYDSMTEDDHDKLSASVRSIGSLSDTGTAYTSQQEHLTESQMFADPDSDTEESINSHPPNDETLLESEGLPFAIASGIASAEASCVEQVEVAPLRVELKSSEYIQADMLPPLPDSPLELTSSRTSIPSTTLPARPMSIGHLPCLTYEASEVRNDALSNSTPAIISTSSSRPPIYHDSELSLNSLPSLPPKPASPTLAHSSSSLETSPPEDISAIPPREKPIQPSVFLPSSDGPLSCSSDNASESDWEEDEAARKKLSESMFFSHEDAGSLYMSAMSGVLEKPIRSLHQENLAPVGSDGARDIDNAIGASLWGGRRKGEVEGEVLTEEEVDQRLNQFLESMPPTESAEVTPVVPPSRRMKKRLAEIDYVEIWVPALANSSASAEAPVVGSSGKGVEATHHEHLPGSFSIYSASPPARKMASASPRPSTPMTVSGGVKFVDDAHVPPNLPTDRVEQHPHVSKDAEVEVFIGKVITKTDLAIAGLLVRIFALLGVVISAPESEDDKEILPAPKQSNEGGRSKKKAEVVVGEIDCRLVTSVPGKLLLDDRKLEQKQTQDGDDGKVILDLNIQHTRLTLSTVFPKATSSFAGNIVTTTRLSLGNIELRDTEGAFIQFTSNPPECFGVSSYIHTGKKRASSLEPGVAVQSDVKVTISNVGRRTKVDVETLPLHVVCHLGKVEELLRFFGGLGGFLGLSSSGPSGFNTPTPADLRQTKGVTWKEEGTRSHQDPTARPATTLTPELKIEANIGGLIVDIEGEEGAVGLRTSIIKVRKRNDLATIVGIENFVLLGPHLTEMTSQSEVRVIVDNTRMEFSSKPNDEDLARLLKLLTPSKDKFAPDDDILLDTLFQQRRQGSALRVSMEQIRVDVDDISECERFQGLGDELSRVLAVTNYIPQDERPGLLTLLYVGNTHTSVNFGETIGKIDLRVKELELCHIGAPSLIAIAMGSIGMKRNNQEELVGEGLPKEIAIRGFANHAAAGTRKVTTDEDRPMVMIRLVGDDPEPVIKFKLWNLRLEYNVDTLLALMNSPSSPADSIAREMVDSIATLTEKQVRREQRHKKRHMNSPLDTTMVAPPAAESPPKALRVDIAVRDSIIGLNPLILPSRGLLILTDSRIHFQIPSPQAELEMSVEIKKASLSLIDDTTNLLTPEVVLQEGRHKRRKEALTEYLAAIVELGYVSVASLSAARAILKLVESEVPGDKCIDLELYDDLIILETCADSTQTLLGIFNGLKPPLPEGEEVKYCTEVMPLDMFASLIDDAFVPGKRQEKKEETLPASASSSIGVQETTQEDSDGDMVGDDVPMNLTFVESYYGNPRVNYDYPQKDLVENVLDDDLTHLVKPPKLLKVGEKGLKTFEEQFQLLDDAPLEILDNHFSVIPKASLIEIAANSAIGAPVRIKIRDVHFIWNLHDGYDWPKTRDTISKAVKKVEGRVLQRRGSGNDPRPVFDAEDDDAESVIGDLLFNSIYIGIPANRDPRELSRQINNNLDSADVISETGSYASTAIDYRPASRNRSSTDLRVRGLKLSRSRTHKMQIELRGLCLDFVLFPQNGGETQSSVDLKVRDMEIIDNVPTSTWKKFVTYMRDAGKRETGSQMAHIEVLNVKPVPTLAASELVIKVSTV